MPDTEIARKRNVMNAEQRMDVLERTSQAAREALEEERRQRDAKTARLRLARMQAEARTRQL
ncbi:hypothetical protein FHX08_006381 [Rhizobium sp. BK529]|uniref:hypothetical protein n=1 Tax=unclassified Rhizobium TaxID=2613769 RepID=UPI001052E908|nr:MULTISPECIES: hypothetical protein [unclassified Rhizobium]MBB3595961.1 hypothetical protein [Rhizobium sp. BK529]TCR96342.1 hypothetical protein EV281_111109 [Rhizobium sp. BK418]